MIWTKAEGCRVTLDDGREVLGVLGEPWLCEGKRDMPSHGGWRAYCEFVKRR